MNIILFVLRTKLNAKSLLKTTLFYNAVYEYQLYRGIE